MWMFYWIGLQIPRVFAAGPPLATNPGEGISIANPLSCDDATGCITGILKALVGLAAPVVAIMVLVGGFQIMSSAGNEEKLKKGKQTIIYAVAGYAIILLATGVAAIINDIVSKSAAQ